MFALKKVERDTKCRCCTHLYGQQWLLACQALKNFPGAGNQAPAGQSHSGGLDAQAPPAAAGRPSLYVCPSAHPSSPSRPATQHTLAGTRCQSIAPPSVMLLVESPIKCSQEDLIWMRHVVWREKSRSPPLSALWLPPHRWLPPLKLGEQDLVCVQVRSISHQLTGPRSNQN